MDLAKKDNSTFKLVAQSQILNVAKRKNENKKKMNESSRMPWKKVFPLFEDYGLNIFHVDKKVKERQ